jgi:hypothetical protein
VPLQTELRFRPRRYEQPPTLEGLRGDKTSRWLADARSGSSDNDLRSGRPNNSSDDLRADAAATRPSPTAPLEGRGQAIKTKASSGDKEHSMKGINFREVVFLQRQQDESDAGAPHPGARKVEGCDA